MKTSTKWKIVSVVLALTFAATATLSAFAKSNVTEGCHSLLDAFFTLYEASIDAYEKTGDANGYYDVMDQEMADYLESKGLTDGSLIDYSDLLSSDGYETYKAMLVVWMIECLYEQMGLGYINQTDYSIEMIQYILNDSNYFATYVKYLQCNPPALVDENGRNQYDPDTGELLRVDASEIDEAFVRNSLKEELAAAQTKRATQIEEQGGEFFTDTPSIEQMLRIFVNYVVNGTKDSDVPLFAKDMYLTTYDENYNEIKTLVATKGDDLYVWLDAYVPTRSSEESEYTFKDQVELIYLPLYNYMFGNCYTNPTTTTSAVTKLYTLFNLNDITNIGLTPGMTNVTNVTAVTNVTNVTGATNVTNVSATNVSLPY